MKFQIPDYKSEDVIAVLRGEADFDEVFQAFDNAWLEVYQYALEGHPMTWNNGRNDYVLSEDFEQEGKLRITSFDEVGPVYHHTVAGERDFLHEVASVKGVTVNEIEYELV